jgi:FkbM family methyltransferase
MVAAHRSALTLFNVLYRRLGTNVHAGLQSRFAKIFRDGDHALAEGRWVVKFAGRDITIPLRSDRAWLDWDAALSILGHEPAIKQTYSTLLMSTARPDLFIDIGANYGMHSLLFLVCGVETIAFEPNRNCLSYIRELCKLNGVTPRLEHAALGAAHGRLELVFPERETWLGSLDPDVIKRLGTTDELRRESVSVRMLDDFLPQLEGRRVLIKIDVEELEHAVLTGAAETLRRHRPLILFETHRGKHRPPVFDLFEREGYRLAHIPLRPGEPLRMVSRDEFLGSDRDDFLAVPAERLAADGSTKPEGLFAENC